MKSIGIFTANRAEVGLLTPVSKALVDVGIKPCWHEIPSGSFMAAANHAAVQLAEAEQDDFYIVPCDRQEMVGVALELFTHNKPFAHFQAGDTGSGVHDEVYRFIISRCASLHFCETQQSADTLLHLGEEAWRVKVVGSTAFDDVEPVFTKNPVTPFDLLLIHPDTFSMEETHRDCLRALALLNKGQPCVAIGPNKDTHWEVVDMNMRKYAHDWPFFYYYPEGVSRPEFLGLMKMCRRFITNSSSAMKELPHFDVGKLVNIGERNKDRQPVKIQTGGSQKIAQILKDLVIRPEILLRKRFVY